MCAALLCVCVCVHTHCCWRPELRILNTHLPLARANLGSAMHCALKPPHPRRRGGTVGAGSPMMTTERPQAAPPEWTYITHAAPRP